MPSYFIFLVSLQQACVDIGCYGDLKFFWLGKETLIYYTNLFILLIFLSNKSINFLLNISESRFFKKLPNDFYSYQSWGVNFHGCLTSVRATTSAI